MSEISFNNVTNRFVLKQKLSEIFLELDHILSMHAGPFAANCVIGSKWRQVNDVDEFTKDGIKILRHLLVSEDPIARFAARMTRFVGIAVDNRCHDGTTTAMTLFCKLALVAISKMDGSIVKSDLYRWSLIIKKVIGVAARYLDSLKITEEDLLDLCKNYGIETTSDDIRGAIGYHMSMISSKGDHDLSSKIAQVIRATPRHVHGIFQDTPMSVETDEPFIIRRQDYDIAFNANIGNMHDFNHKNDTQYFSEDAVLFVTGNEIVNHSFESAFLSSFISTNPRVRNDLLPQFGMAQGWEELCEDKKHLIILTPMLSDPALMELILLFNKDHPNCKISWFNTQVGGRLKTCLNKTIHYMSGALLFNETMNNADLSLIGLTGSKVSVRNLGHVVRLYGLYKRTDSVFHPFFDDPSLFEPYNRFKEELEELISFAKENVANPNLEQAELTYITSLYRVLTCQNIYDIDIGGSIHDQYANRTVYEDAIGASLSAISEGVILGGYAHLIKYFGTFNLSEYNDDEVSVHERVLNALIYLVGNTLHVEHGDSFYHRIITGINSKFDYISVDPNGELDENSEYPVTVNTLNKESMLRFLEMKQGAPILLQAFAGYHEQFKRFGVILPMLANTANHSDMRIRDDNDVR